MTDAPAVFDLEHLRRTTRGEPALEAELFGLFNEQRAMWMRALDPAGDADSWKAGLHTLKGMAAGLGAFALAEACARAEALAGDAGTPVARSVALDEVRMAAEAAASAMARHHQRAASSFRSSSQTSSS